MKFGPFTVDSLPTAAPPSTANSPRFGLNSNRFPLAHLKWSRARLSHRSHERKVVRWLKVKSSRWGHRHTSEPVSRLEFTALRNNKWILNNSTDRKLRFYVWPSSLLLSLRQLPLVNSPALRSQSLLLRIAETEGWTGDYVVTLRSDRQNCVALQIQDAGQKRRRMAHIAMWHIYI